MPINPHKNETEQDYMKRCIPQLISEGKPHDQAIAICHSMLAVKAGEHKKSRIGYNYDFIKDKVHYQLQAYGMVLNKNDIYLFTSNQTNKDIYQLARMCAIPLENIIFIDALNKTQQFNNLETYYTADFDEVKLVNELTTCHAIYCKDEE